MLQPFYKAPYKGWYNPFDCALVLSASLMGNKQLAKRHSMQRSELLVVPYGACGYEQTWAMIEANRRVMIEIMVIQTWAVKRSG